MLSLEVQKANAAFTVEVVVWIRRSARGILEQF
jgi:hypothetical protein